MTSEETKKLIAKYNAGQCTEKERALLEQWMMQLMEEDIVLSESRVEQIKQEIRYNLPRENNDRKQFKLWTLVATTAAISMIGIATWMYDPHLYIAKTKPEITDIAPGSNRATLTLSSGHTISLSSNQSGIVIRPEKLSYTDGTKIPVADLSAVQTISTPKGGQYQVELPEGTKVWLNSSTVVQYAANLNIESGQRKFRLVAGEAYFSVSKDKAHPFIVTTKRQDVTVLGTEFNIDAYKPETAIKTTLVEGLVKINSKSHQLEKMLRPGQQANNSGASISIKQVDLDLETAWKRGKTEFEDADMKTVMTMLERWYDIETVYQTSNMESRFTGTVSRSKNISAVLKLLESTGEVHFKIEGRKVIVMK